MLCARATLTAGPRHKRYKSGAAVNAVVFIKDLEHPRDLNGESFKSIAARGWTRIAISGHKVLPDDFEFSAPEHPEAAAFRHALDKGIGILVLGLVQ